jgi:hypothetical protein
METTQHHWTRLSNRSKGAQSVSYFVAAGGGLMVSRMVPDQVGMGATQRSPHPCSHRVLVAVLTRSRRRCDYTVVTAGVRSGARCGESRP